jgi:V/A-type H+-transporting ATPase subunit D
MIPDYKENIKYITMKLDENDRSSQIRLMKVKNQMLEETYHYEAKAEAAAKEIAAKYAAEDAAEDNNE